jgi:hypothetical protein
LRAAADSILRLQNADGGFPYKRGIVQDHMGILATRAAADTSTTFATWFRVHTLALMAEVLTDDARLDIPFRFNRFLSMGWHAPWCREENPVRAAARFQEIRPALGLRVRSVRHRLRRQEAS